MISQFKIISFLCCLFLCPLADAASKTADEEKFDKLVKDLAFWQNNFAKQKKAAEDFYNRTKSLEREKREALDRNPEVKAQYENWRAINNLFIERSGPRGEYHEALRAANKAIAEMINALNERGKIEVRYMNVLNHKRELLRSVR